MAASSDALIKKLQKDLEALQKQVDKIEKDDPSDKVQDLIKRLDQIEKDQVKRDKMQDSGNQDVNDNFKQLNVERKEIFSRLDKLESKK